MIDKTLKKQINVVCRKKITNCNESTIPQYGPFEQGVTSNDKVIKMKLDKRFLEVLHSGGPIYIRETTIVWLLQEGERVSSDRLFRVRAKQPYNTSTKLLLPSTNIDGSSPIVKLMSNWENFAFFGIS